MLSRSLSFTSDDSILAVVWLLMFFKKSHCLTPFHNLCIPQIYQIPIPQLIREWTISMLCRSTF